MKTDGVVAVGVRDASKKIKIPASTLSRWITKGVVTVGKNALNQYVFYEADLEKIKKIKITVEVKS